MITMEQELNLWRLMMARPSTLKVVGFNILALGAVGVGLFCHYVQPVFANDSSHLTYMVAATQAAIVIYSIYDCFFPVGWITGFIKFEEANLRLLGLIGTLVGLSIIVSVINSAVTVSGGSPDLLTNVLTAFTGGLKTAFNPTLVGIVSWYWTRHLLYFSRNERW
jgi:hypothetical protein